MTTKTRLFVDEALPIAKAFVAEHYADVYLTRFSGYCAVGFSFVTYLHGPDGPRVYTNIDLTTGEVRDSVLRP